MQTVGPPLLCTLSLRMLEIKLLCIAFCIFSQQWVAECHLALGSDAISMTAERQGKSAPAGVSPPLLQSVTGDSVAETLVPLKCSVSIGRLAEAIDLHYLSTS